MSDQPKSSQREILARIDERTKAHYEDFREFRDTANKRLDTHAANIKVLEAHRNWIGGGLALAALSLPLLWSIFK